MVHLGKYWDICLRTQTMDTIQRTVNPSAIDHSILMHSASFIVQITYWIPFPHSKLCPKTLTHTHTLCEQWAYWEIACLQTNLHSNRSAQHCSLVHTVYMMLKFWTEWDEFVRSCSWNGCSIRGFGSKSKQRLHNLCIYIHVKKFYHDYRTTSNTTHRDFKAKQRNVSNDDSGNMSTIFAWTNRIAKFKPIVRLLFQFSRKWSVSFDEIWNI